MAIDRTGISSLDTGASDITYSGNEGPKSPQQQQQMMMAQLEQEYEQYRMEQIEIDPSQVLSFEEWYQATYEASRQGVAEGGIARLGYQQGQLVQPGPGRPGYQGDRPPGVHGQRTGGGYSDRERAEQQTRGAPPGKDVVTPSIITRPHYGAETRDRLLKEELERERLELEPDVKEKTILEKAKGMFKGPVFGAIEYFGKKTMPRYLKSVLATHRKKMGYDHPMLYEEAETDERLQAINDAIAKAERGGLSQSEFETFMPDWQKNLGSQGGGEGQGGGYMGYPSYAAWQAAQGAGSSGTTDATGAPVSDWNVASLDQPYDRSTPAHKFGGEWFYGADGGRTPAAYGGIMGNDGRRAYGLGSIFKPFKKAAKKIKKIAKSDVGKAALMAAAYRWGPEFLSGTGLEMGTAGTWSSPGWGELMSNPKSINAMRGIVGASVIGGLTAEENEDDNEGYEKWLAEKNKWLGQFEEFPTTPVDPIYQRTAMVADGGRIGYDNGGLSSLDFVDKIYSDEARALAGTSGQPGGLLQETTNTGEYRFPEDIKMTGQAHTRETLDAANKMLDIQETKKLQLEKVALKKGWSKSKFNKRYKELVEQQKGGAMGGWGDSTSSAQYHDLNETLNLMEHELGVWSDDEAQENLDYRLREPNYQSMYQAQGGRIGYKKGGNYTDRQRALNTMYGIRSKAQEGGLMNLGGMEKDYRQEGGFVPLGGEERADDVPARLSKNEFVFTADAVRAAGGGDVDAGAEVMENVMENLEQGGQISEESQGLEGARDMFATSQRLEGVL